MSIHQLDIYGKDKVETAIERLKAIEPKEGYYLAFSGGKDSVVIKALADMAGVKYDAHYSLTTVDPPELVQFVKTFKDVTIDIPRDKDGNRVTMWNLIPRKVIPPTRLARYCCEVLKEANGEGRITVTGVRWAESANRKNNQGVVTIYNADKEIKENAAVSITSKGGVILNNDNDASRQLIDSCYRKRKTVLNPIIDWDDGEVWEFIKYYKVPYCKLYDKGYKRLGCIGCPMNTNNKSELDKYPTYKRAYLRTFEKMLNERKRKGLASDWQTPQEVMTWWLGE